MDMKKCIKSKCEFLVKSYITGEILCTDTNSPIENVCWCGIADDPKSWGVVKSKGELTNAS